MILLTFHSENFLHFRNGNEPGVQWSLKLKEKITRPCWSGAPSTRANKSSKLCWWAVTRLRGPIAGQHRSFLWKGQKEKPISWLPNLSDQASGKRGPFLVDSFVFFLFKQATRPFSIWDCTFSKEWYDLFFFLYFSCFFLNSFRVLDAQVAFHQGRTAEAGRLLHQAQEELTRLVVRDDQLSQLVSLGEPFWNTFLWNSTKGQLSGTPFVKWNWKDPFLEQVLWNQTKRVSFWNTFRQMKRERSRSGTSFVKPNKNVPFLEHFIKWNQYDLFSGTRFLKGNKYDPFLEHVSSNRTKKVTFWNMFHK